MTDATLELTKQYLAGPLLAHGLFVQPITYVKDGITYPIPEYNSFKIIDKTQRHYHWVTIENNHILVGTCGLTHYPNDQELRTPIEHPHAFEQTLAWILKQNTQ